MITDILTDTLIDGLKLLPFLFLTYLLMEYIEHHSLSKVTMAISKVGKMGPVLGGITGIVPQCGFSAAAAGLFAGGVITTGTLVGVFLSTSDEMLPLFISHGFALDKMVKIIFVKILIAIISGASVDFIFKRLNKKRKNTIEEFCEREHCDCHDGILKSALMHTVKIWLFVLAITFLLNMLFEVGGFTHIFEGLFDRTIFAVPVICLVGLIPNCGASVIITELFLKGLITPATLMAGLLVNSGVGLLVVFRTNRNLRENFALVALMLVLGIFWGFVLEGIGFFV